MMCRVSVLIKHWEGEVDHSADRFTGHHVVCFPSDAIQ